MKKILLAFILGLAISGCSNDDSGLNKKNISLKINGQERAYAEILITEGTYFEPLINGGQNPAAVTQVAAYYEPEEFENHEAFYFRIVREGSYVNKIILSAYVDMVQEYHPTEQNPMTFNITTNNSHKLKGTFSGTLIGENGDLISITEGKFDLNF